MNPENGINSLLLPCPSRDKCPFSTCQVSPGKTWPDIFSGGTLAATVASGAGAGQQEKSGRHTGPLPRPQGTRAGKTVGVGSETWTYAQPKMTLAREAKTLSEGHTAACKGALRAACPTFLQEQEAPSASDTFIYLYNNRSARPCARNTQLPPADCPLVVSGLLDLLQQ